MTGITSEDNEAALGSRREATRRDDEIEAAILHLVAERGQGKTICPSEVARHLGGAEPEAWRRFMAPVKRVATSLAESGMVVVTRKGKPIGDLEHLRGIYRIGRPRETR